MKTWIPFLGILLNLNLFIAAAVTEQDILEAIKDGNLTAIQGFIEAGVNFNQTNGCILTPLTHAIDCDRIEIARAILAAPGTDINYTTIFGAMPIHYATQKGADEMIRFLLADERCARNHVDDNGFTPLHSAASMGNTSTVEILLEDLTVDCNIVNKYDKTALDYAILNDRFANTIVLINDPRVAKDRIDDKGMTYIHKIAKIVDRYEIRRVGRLRVLDTFIGLGVIDINHQDREGKTALHYAAEVGDPEMILKLTAAGADSAIVDESGQNALEYAEKRALEEKYINALYSVFGHSNVGLK